MDKFDNNDAIAVIQKALESGAIKLLGTDDIRFPASRGSADAVYLRTLLKELQEDLPPKP